MDRTEEIIRIVKSAARMDKMPGPEESLFDSGFLDSFALTDIVPELEMRFRIKIPDADLSRTFESIDSIDRYVARATAGREG